MQNKVEKIITFALVNLVLASSRCSNTPQKPEIYDDGVRFSIEDYILPEVIEQDHPQRKLGKTLFLFPFNKDNRAVAFDEILSTLKRLADVKPLLFLNSLSEIEWTAEESNGRYSLITSGVFGSGLDLRYKTIKGEKKRRPRIIIGNSNAQLRKGLS